MLSLIKAASETLRAQNLKLATAESCTGGMIAAGFTDLAGSSSIFDRGFITYSNESKMDMLGVLQATLDAHGAVSAETVKQMCEGTLKNSLADVTIAVTGIAGPTGGSEDKPVGTVYIGLAKKGADTQTFSHIFAGDRQAVRQQTVEQALEHLMDLIS